MVSAITRSPSFHDLRYHHYDHLPVANSSRISETLCLQITSPLDDLPDTHIFRQGYFPNACRHTDDSALFNERPGVSALIIRT
jgi:hypothetical protein